MLHSFGSVGDKETGNQSVDHDVDVDVDVACAVILSAQAFNNLIVLSREEAGANLICHEGGVGRLVSMLRETQEPVIVGAMRVLACLAKKNTKRVGTKRLSC